MHPKIVELIMQTVTQEIASQQPRLLEKMAKFDGMVAKLEQLKEQVTIGLTLLNDDPKPRRIVVMSEHTHPELARKFHKHSK